MKAKKHSIFIISIVSIYVLSVLIFVFSLVAEYNKGFENSQNRFNSITRDLSRISKNYMPPSKKFYDEFLVSLGNISDIAGIQLKYGEELIFSYPSKYSDFENINSSLVNVYTTVVFTENQIPISLMASIYLLKPSSIFFKGRIALVVILIATLVTAVYLFILTKNGTFPTESENDELEEAEYPEIEIFDTEQEELSESESKENEETSLEDNENTKEEEKDDDVLAFLNEKKQEPEEQEINNSTSTSEIEQNKNDEPLGLFANNGFGWEQYMLTRLDSELVRSASSDRDLSLFTIKVQDIDWDSDCGKEISRIILEKVKFNDLAFNYKTDGVTAIFQNQNTDKSLVIAEELYSELAACIEKFNLQLKITIGISTRSLRLISGSRLANESEEALKRADEDSPIIAFRVNPERYKDYLASESFQELEETQNEQEASETKALEEEPNQEENTKESTSKEIENAD